MNLTDRIENETAEFMREEIKKCGGNEVFFRGILNENKKVCKAEVIARGNINSVPAIVSRMGSGEVIIHNHPSGYLYPSDNDVSIASYYGNLGGGSYIVNNDVTDVYIIVEPVVEEKIDVDLIGYFDKEGKISKILPGFEPRNEQEEMAEFIKECLNSGEKAIVEAGTGTGKTLAYLIPALLYGIKNRIKIVVSTNTINLQEQLMRKDIPLVEKILEEEFKYVLVKGRSNYLCLRKINHIDKNEIEEFSNVQKKEFEALIAWAGDTVEGDRQELSFEVSFSVWEKAASESDLCMKNRCPYKERCFFHKARRKTQSADLLIINHHVYFADLAIRKETGFLTDYSILPNYGIAIFDEAHNIEGVARDYFSREISKYAFNKLMNNIYNYKGEKAKNAGVITKVISYLSDINFDKSRLDEAVNIFNSEIILEHRNIYEKVNDFFLKFSMIMSEKDEKDEIKVRLKPEEVIEDKQWNNELFTRIRDIKSSYGDYFKQLSKFEKLVAVDEEIDEFGFVADMYRYIDRVKGFFEEFDFIFKFDKDDFVYWSEMNMKKGHVKISATPIEIKKDLKDALYENLKRIIFTSATLTIGDSFEYFKNSVGIFEDVKNKKINSPFDYGKNMQILIPTDIEDPGSGEFFLSVMDFMLDLIRYSNGNTFVLFTSYSNLNFFYYRMRESLIKEGFNILIQGEVPRHRMLDIYKNSKKPVLFGTDSFWEGVDVKGEKLSSVIIVKLPFKVPSEPVVEAIIEKIEREGRSSFMEYQVPEAVVKFKQGVGRLIRAKDDKGIITILDNRLLKKSYGRIFMRSLPGGRVVAADRAKILRSIDVI